MLDPSQSQESTQLPMHVSNALVTPSVLMAETTTVIDTTTVSEMITVLAMTPGSETTTASADTCEQRLTLLSQDCQQCLHVVVASVKVLLAGGKLPWGCIVVPNHICSNILHHHSNVCSTATVCLTLYRFQT